MRRFEDGATITIEPWRCGAFPVIKDLIVDRGAYEKILQAGGYVSVNTGGVPDGNAIQSLSRLPTRLWTLLLVSVVGLCRNL